MGKVDSKRFSKHLFRIVCTHFLASLGADWMLKCVVGLGLIKISQFEQELFYAVTGIEHVIHVYLRN